MHRLILTGAAFGLCLSISGAGQTPSAADRAEKRLAELLQPGARFDGRGFATTPVRWSGRQAIEQPSVPLSVYRGLPPRPDAPPRKPARPQPLAEDQPLATSLEQPQPPKRVKFPVTPLLRLL